MATTINSYILLFSNVFCSLIELKSVLELSNVQIIQQHSWYGFFLLYWIIQSQYLFYLCGANTDEYWTKVQ